MLHNLSIINANLNHSLKLTYTLNNFDKLSNTIWGYKKFGKKIEEPQIFAEFFREKFFDYCGSLFLSRLQLEENKKFQWQKYFGHVKKEFYDKVQTRTNISKEEVPVFVRRFRNLSHGAFQKKEQNFNSLAVHRVAGMPNETTDWFYCVFLAFLADPKALMDYFDEFGRTS
jgi:hypothetical protein